MTEDYADYLPEGVARGTPREYIPPEPGTGIVYVGPPRSDGVWVVSWQGPDSRFSSTRGSEEAVVEWALAQPAAKRLICRDGSGQEPVWEDLPDDTPVRGSPTL